MKFTLSQRGYSDAGIQALYEYGWYSLPKRGLDQNVINVYYDQPVHHVHEWLINKVLEGVLTRPYDIPRYL